MTITTTIKKTETITKEISLPYYSAYAGTYYRINEDKTVLRVTDYLIGKGIHLFASAYQDEAAAAEPITASEFEAALTRAIEHMDTVLSNRLNVAV